MHLVLSTTMTNVNFFNHHLVSQDWLSKPFQQDTLLGNITDPDGNNVQSAHTILILWAIDKIFAKWQTELMFAPHHHVTMVTNQSKLSNAFFWRFWKLYTISDAEMKHLAWFLCRITSTTLKRSTFNSIATNTGKSMKPCFLQLNFCTINETSLKEGLCLTVWLNFF